MSELPLPPQELLLEVCRATMPFGKYKGMKLLDLPEAYLAWFARQGFPKGKLGQQLETALVIKTHGLRPMLEPLMRR